MPPRPLRMDIKSVKRRAWYRKNSAGVLARNKKWALANPEKTALGHRRKQLRRLYGLTLEEVASRLAAQGGACAICSGALTFLSPQMHVDHCHTTNVFRGVLCHKCNVSLAPLENMEFRKSAEAYLLRSAA